MARKRHFSSLGLPSFLVLPQLSVLSVSFSILVHFGICFELQIGINLIDTRGSIPRVIASPKGAWQSHSRQCLLYLNKQYCAKRFPRQCEHRLGVTPGSIVFLKLFRSINDHFSLSGQSPRFSETASSLFSEALNFLRCVLRRLNYKEIIQVNLTGGCRRCDACPVVVPEQIDIFRVRR